MGEMYKPQNNGPHTVLYGTINEADTSFEVENASILPQAPNVLTIGTEENAELVLLESVTGNMLTVQRGFNGTTATSWDAGTWIYRAITAQDIEELQRRATKPGGTTGQVLTKASDADFDTAWKSIPAVEYEAQALTEAQKAQARSNVDAASAGEVGTISESVTALDGVVSKIGEAKVASATVEATEGFQTVIEFPLEIGHTYLVVANIYTSVGDSTIIMLSLEALNAGNYNGAFTNRGNMEGGGGITASMIVKAVSDESKAVVKSYKYSSKSYNYIVKLQTVIIK